MEKTISGLIVRLSINRLRIHTGNFGVHALGCMHPGLNRGLTQNLVYCSDQKSTCSFLITEGYSHY